jgi:hypothetical protein
MAVISRARDRGVDYVKEFLQKNFCGLEYASITPQFS